MSHASLCRPRAAAQGGVALIVGLVILVIVSLIGIAAFSITTQQERMAGNSRDRMLALEAAEAALRGCENFISNNGGVAVFTAAPGTYPGMYKGPTDSSLPSITESGPAQAESWWQPTSKTVLSVAFAPTSGAAPASPPSCVAEAINLFPNQGYTVGNPQNSANAASIAHITAHGYGLNINTVVRLESYYGM
jgi:Tfp pilus assembly protein PilX